MIAKLAPCFRLPSVFVFSCSISVLNRTEIVVFLLFLGLFYAVFFMDLRQIFKRLLKANVFVLFLCLTLPWSVQGSDLFRYGIFSITDRGLFLAATTALKCNAILIWTMIFLYKIKWMYLISSLQNIRLPKKFLFLLLLTVRYIDDLGEEWHKIHRAAELRGFLPKTNFYSYKTYAYMIGMGLINSIERGHRVYRAMQLRGFDGNFRSLVQNKATILNCTLFIAICAFCILLVFADSILK